MHPVLFHIFTFPVRAYGAFVVIGFLMGLWRAMRLAAFRMKTEPAESPRRIHPDTVFDVALPVLLAGVLGARVLYVVLDWGAYVRHPADAFRIWEGGLSFHGGLLFGILYLVWFCRARRISLLAMADLCTPSWALAYAIGRIGCFLNGCCYGGPCNLPWAVRFADEQHPGLLTPPSHPSQLYATLFNLIFLVLLLRWEKQPRRDGELFFGYIGMYGFYRFVVECFRAGATSTYLIPALHMTHAHLVSVLMMAFGIAAVTTLRRQGPPVASVAAPAFPAGTPPSPTGVGSSTPRKGA